MNKLRAGPDYDPATETLCDSKGNAVTQDYLDELSVAAEAGYEVETGQVGRPSLSGRGDSPQIRVRVSTELRRRAGARASAEGKSISEAAREALEHYV